jgi:hypothetical protein
MLSQPVAPDVEIPRRSKDPDDDTYIAAAVEGRAVFVVTGDPDLPALGMHAASVSLPRRQRVGDPRAAPRIEAVTGRSPKGAVAGERYHASGVPLLNR